jgi:hypothetical protein
LLWEEKKKRETLNQTTGHIYIEKGTASSTGVMPSVTPTSNESARTNEDLISTFLVKNSEMNKLAQVGASLDPLKWPEFISWVQQMGVFPTPDETRAFNELFRSTLKGAVAEKNRNSANWNSQGKSSVFVHVPQHPAVETPIQRDHGSRAKEFLEKSSDWRTDSFGFETLHSSKVPFGVFEFVRRHQKAVPGHMEHAVIRYRDGPYAYFANELGVIIRERVLAGEE